MKLEIDSPLSLGLSTPTKLSDGLSAFFPIKSEEMTTVDTATNSSASRYGSPTTMIYRRLTIYLLPYSFQSSEGISNGIIVISSAGR